MDSECYCALLVVSLLLNIDLIIIMSALLSMHCKLNKLDQVCTIP